MGASIFSPTVKKSSLLGLDGTSSTTPATSRMSSRRRRGSSSSAQRATSSSRRWDGTRRNYCGVTGPSGLAGTSEGLHPVHKRQKTEKSSTGEAERNPPRRRWRSPPCATRTARGGDVYKQMVVDQDVVDTRRHPGGVGIGEVLQVRCGGRDIFEAEVGEERAPLTSSRSSLLHTL